MARTVKGKAAVPPAPVDGSGTQLWELDGTLYFITAEPVVNAEWARELAARRGWRLETRFPKEPRPVDAAALIWDMGHLWMDAADRRAFLRGLTSRPPAVLTALLSYDDFEEATVACLKNLVIGRRLDELIDQLVARLAGPTDPGDQGNGTELPDPTDSKTLNEEMLALLRLSDDGCPNFHD
jgi:hypothetical protein